MVQLPLREMILFLLAECRRRNATIAELSATDNGLQQRVQQLSSEIDNANRRRRNETSEMRRRRQHARRYQLLMRGMGTEEMETLMLYYDWR